MLVDQEAPERIVGRPEVAQQLVGHLAHGLRLLGQLGQEVPVVDRAPAERLARMLDASPVRADDDHSVHSNVSTDLESGRFRFKGKARAQLAALFLAAACHWLTAMPS